MRGRRNSVAYQLDMNYTHQYHIHPAGRFAADDTEGSRMTEAPSGSTTPAEHLPQLLMRNVAARPDAPAVIEADSTTTFSELSTRAEAWALKLQSKGIGPGDRVGLLMANGSAYLECLFGIAMTGAAVVPFSTWSTLVELEFLIADSGVKLVFTQARFGTRAFAEDLGTLAKSSADAAAFPEVITVSQGCTVLSEGVSDARTAVRVAQPDPHSDALVLYTSGSTSKPKAVRLVHHGICHNGFHIGERQGLRPGDRVFLSAPLFWAYGGANALPAAFSHGAALVLAERFDPVEALHLIAQKECTAVYTLPSNTDAILRAPGFRREATRSLRTGLTIGGKADLLAAINDLGASEICNIYGATETYGNCAVTWHHWPAERRAVCQGLPLPGNVIRIRDAESGDLIPNGQIGLVEVAGNISPGYCGASAAQNAKAFTADGFYRTGDLGMIDDQGCFVFHGRDSEMIKRAGINVSPAEVEDAFRGFPGVSQCCVVGIPDQTRGEKIVAFVVAANGGAADVENLHDLARKVLSKYKHPDHVVFRDSLPLTATGKVKREALREEALRLLGAPADGATP